MILYLGTDPSYYKEQSIVHYPIIKLIPRKIPSSVFEDMLDYTHCIFTSKNTVRILKEMFIQKGLSLTLLQDKSLIALGKITAGALNKEGLSVDFVAEEETQEGVIALLKNIPLQQAYIFLPRSAQSRKNLEIFLQEALVRYQVCDLYDTVAQKIEPLPNFDEIDQIVFTSPSTVAAFFEIFKQLPPGKKITCLGPITEKFLAQKRDEGIS